MILSYILGLNWTAGSTSSTCGPIHYSRMAVDLVGRIFIRSNG